MATRVLDHLSGLTAHPGHGAPSLAVVVGPSTRRFPFTSLGVVPQFTSSVLGAALSGTLIDPAHRHGCFIATNSGLASALRTDPVTQAATHIPAVTRTSSDGRALEVALLGLPVSSRPRIPDRP